MVKPAYSRGKYAKKGAAKSNQPSGGTQSPTSRGGSKYGAPRKKAGISPMVFVTGGVILVVIVMAVLVASKGKQQPKQAIQHVKAMPPKGTLVNAAISAVRSNVSGASPNAASDPTYEVSDLGGSEYQVTGYATVKGESKSFTVHLRQKMAGGLEPSHLEVGKDTYIRRGQRTMFK
ncbi:MAG: hypothetical protein GC159_18515 [Phycisphaera sp.]|nr:hypothetical protein [Phycisphaera sp.]